MNSPRSNLVYRVVYSQSETGNVPQHLSYIPKPETRNPKPSTNKNFKSTSCIEKGVEHYSTYYFVQGGFNFCSSDCNYYSSRWSENSALERENGSTFPSPFRLTANDLQRLLQQICFSQKRKYGKRNTFDFLTKSPAICSAMSFFKQILEDKCRNNLTVPEHEHVRII